MKTKFENEQARALKEAETQAYMKEQYEAQKKVLLAELREINAQLEKL